MKKTTPRNPMVTVVLLGAILLIPVVLVLMTFAEYVAGIPLPHF